MDSEWVRFFELVEQTQAGGPQLRELALQYAAARNQTLSAERQPSPQPNGHLSPEYLNSPIPDVLVVPLSQCVDFLDYLHKRAESLRDQDPPAQELANIQAAARAFWEAVRAALRVEQRSFAHLIPPDFWSSSEEEVLADLRELQEQGGGQELHEFLPEIDRLIRDSERIGT